MIYDCRLQIEKINIETQARRFFDADFTDDTVFCWFLMGVGAFVL